MKYRIPLILLAAATLYAEERSVPPQLPAPAILAPSPADVPPPVAPSTWFEHTASATVRAGHTEAAARALIAWAEAHGGWFTAWNAESVSLRVPNSVLATLLDTLPAFGEIRDKNASVQDRTLEFSELQTQISARRKLLANYFAMVKSSNQDRLQAVEREVVNLTAAIEHLEGQLRFLQAQLGTATVTLYFQLRERDLPAADGSSPFPWINKLNLTDLKEAF